MGIPKFYRWLSERYPLINQAVDQNEFNITIDYLYLDVNGIIHNATHSGHEVRLKPSDSDVAAAVISYIEVILSMVKPRKLLYIAVDGVPPRAKVNQQRKRRFRAAKELEEEQAANKKFNKGDNQDLFDSNCITPGTEFMQNLDRNLKYMIAYKIETERLWHNLDVIYSGYDVPGEGEHKLMEFIREQKRKDQLDPSSYHCIYGLDADLIILSLSLHMSNFVLLREQIDFLSFKNVNKNITTREIKSKTWQFTHISLLREYIQCDILNDLPPSSVDPNIPAISSGEYDLERIIDDFTFLITLCGNDFIPELPSLDIKQGSLDKMLEIYKNILPNFKGQYILENGLPNKQMMKRLFSQLGVIEEESMIQIQSSLEKTHNHPRNKQQANKFQREDENKQKIMNKLGENASMKNIYYLDKFNIDPEDKINRKKIVQSYIDGLFWVYNYYYRGCPSWDWFYPYHYAPMFSDLSEYILDYQEIQFQVGNPVDPFIQLLCCLPPQSANLLPTSYHWLMTDEKSPIKKYYPETFEIDPNGKVNDWEGVELIPFIDINEIMKVVEEYHPDKNVNETENMRNHCSYYTMEYRYDSTLNPYPLKSPMESVMPSIDLCKVYCKKLEMRLPDPRNLPIIDAKYFYQSRLGLPSLFNLTASLYRDFIQINIFGIPSRKESMIVDIMTPPLSHAQVSRFLGYHCSCGYPSCYPGIITKITFPTKKYYYPQYFTKYHTLLPNYFIELASENLNAREQDSYHQTVSFLQDNWLKGFQHQLGTGGVNLQNISCICEVYPVIGITEINSLRQWKYASEPLIFPFELINFNENPKFVPPMNIPFVDKYHIDDKVIITEPIYYRNNTLLYGKEGKIVSVDNSKLNLTVDVEVSEYTEPKFGYTLLKSVQTDMMNVNDACRKLQISPKALFRLLGSVVFDKEFDVGLNMFIHKNNDWYVLPGYISIKYGARKYNNCWKDPKETSLLISGQLIENTINISNGNGSNNNNNNINNNNINNNNNNDIIRSYFISSDAYNVIQLYMNRYYDIVDLLEKSDFVYFDSYKLWGRDGKIYVDEICKWKQTLSYTNIRLIPSNSSLFTTNQMKVLEYSTKAVEKLENSLNKQKITVILSENKLIGQSELFEDVVCNTLIPKLGSRVISLGRNNIPFGLKGTVVGIHPSTGYLEVVFDKKFLSGSSLNGLCKTGYGKVVSYVDVLNISDIPELSS